MKRLAIAAKALALAALLAGGADAQPKPKPSVITNADWLRKPTGEDFSRFYPQVAMMLNLPGRVIIHCLVAVSGRLETCAVIEETPMGVGFGKAALSLSQGFLMRPQTRDGAPVAGGQINIPIVFLLPTSPTPPEPPPPTPKSAAALAAAQRAVAALRPTDPASQNYDRRATAFELNRWPDVSPENSAAIAKALRASYPVRLKEASDGQARLYASQFTAAELAQLEAFFKTGAASVLYGQTAEAQANMSDLMAEGRRRQLAIGREIFCASHGCEPEGGPSARPDEPQWLHTPTLAQVWQGRPDLARAFNLPGSAEVTCTVMALGALSQCEVSRETPTGLGFGAAAQALAAFYSLDLTAPKAPGVGQKATFGIHFDAPEPVGPSTYEAVAARSPKSLAMARELLTHMNPELPNPTALQRRQAALQPLPRGITRADQDAVFDVLDQAYRRSRVEMTELRAAWLTTQLTDAELTDALKTWRGPIVASWQTHNAALTEASQRAAAQANVRIWGDVSTAFCAEHACYVPRPPRPAQPSGVSSAPSTAKP